MGGVAGGRLASAVSKAGALGMVGMGSAGSAEELSRELALVDVRLPFGIGMVDWVMRRNPALWETALDARPATLSVSFGEHFDWVQTTQAAGIRAITQVPDLPTARRALDAGVDLLVVRGLEGGGHGKPLNDLLPLLEATAEIADRPVLAAGAITTHSDVQRAMASGAAGVWVGTAFAACDESLLQKEDKEALLRGKETVLTSEFDRRAGYDWPADTPERVLLGQERSISAGLGVQHLVEERPAHEVVASLMGDGDGDS
jgi:nitronate monooxygenase